MEKVNNDVQYISLPIIVLIMGIMSQIFHVHEFNFVTEAFNHSKELMIPVTMVVTVMLFWKLIKKESTKVTWVALTITVLILTITNALPLGVLTIVLTGTIVFLFVLITGKL